MRQTLAQLLCCLRIIGLGQGNSWINWNEIWSKHGSLWCWSAAEFEIVCFLTDAELLMDWFWMTTFCFFILLLQFNSLFMPAAAWKFGNWLCFLPWSRWLSLPWKSWPFTKSFTWLVTPNLFVECLRTFHLWTFYVLLTAGTEKDPQYYVRLHGGGGGGGGTASSRASTEVINWNF